jgi:hypothetical protein
MSNTMSLYKISSHKHIIPFVREEGYYFYVKYLVLNENLDDHIEAELLYKRDKVSIVMRQFYLSAETLDFMHWFRRNN